jgi:hypothetical protein
LALCGLIACGSGSAQDDAGMNDDAATAIDAGRTGIDARPSGIDAGPTEAPPPSQVITPGGGRVTGGDITMDVTIGSWHSQEPATGGGNTIEGASPVKQ